MGTGALDADSLSTKSKNVLKPPTYLTDGQCTAKNGNHIDRLVVLLDGDLQSNLSSCWKKDQDNTDKFCPVSLRKIHQCLLLF